MRRGYLLPSKSAVMPRMFARREEHKWERGVKSYPSLKP